MEAEWIAKTRWRDIPFEQAMKCGPQNLSVHELQEGAEAWEKSRGTEIEVILPALTMEPYPKYCDGPFYRSAINPNQCACAHVVQLGDDQ